MVLGMHMAIFGRGTTLTVHQVDGNSDGGSGNYHICEEGGGGEPTNKNL